MAFEEVLEMAGLGSVIAMIAAWATVIFIVAIGFYIYHALVLMTIAKKLKYKNAWIAWIPIVQLALYPILAKKEWPWVFMFLVPIANLVFAIMWTWKIFERRKYPGWLSLVFLLGIIPGLNVLAGIAYIVIFGLVAWKDM